MTSFPAGTFTPAPGRGSLGRMLRTHARVEASLTLRHGEQVLLTLLIPLALLIGLSLLDILPASSLGSTSKVDWITPRILALAVMSSAFTGQAIALGFDRRYGVLKRLSATALPRWLLVAGRLAAAVVVVALQSVIIGVVAAFLGWSPTFSGLASAILLLVLGTLAFGALGVLLGGALGAGAVVGLAVGGGVNRGGGGGGRGGRAPAGGGGGRRARGGGGGGGTAGGEIRYKRAKKQICIERYGGGND